MRLQENPDTPSLVVKNTAEVWDVVNNHSKAWIVGDELTDEMVIEFFKPSGRADRNAAIEVLNSVDAWPDGYKPEKR